MKVPRQVLVHLFFWLVFTRNCKAARGFLEEDELEEKQHKQMPHAGGGFKQIQDISGLPLPLDTLLDQKVPSQADDQGQNVKADCTKGSELSELDMCLTSAQLGMFASLRRGTGKRRKRQASANGFSLWKNGVIPYLFNSTFLGEDRDAILGAMLEWEKTTCVRFRQAVTGDRDFVVFRDGRRCSTNIGRIGQDQVVSLARNCRSKRILIHELGHVIGLIHEHQRYDRDKYVKVLLENVRNMSQERYQFSKLLSGSITDKAVQYDYTSIMHYGRNYFARSPELTTLQTTESLYQDVIGRAEKPSFNDIETVNQLYQCSVLGPHRNSLLDSTCEFFARRGECTGKMQDTVRPLCAISCRLYQDKLSTPTAQVWVQTQAPQTNHLQPKPADYPWDTSPGLARTSDIKGMNGFNDILSLRNADALMTPIISQQSANHQQESSSQHAHSQGHQLSLLLDSGAHTLQQTNQNVRNFFPSEDVKVALLQSHLSLSSPRSSLYQALVLGSSADQKSSRILAPLQVNSKTLQQTSVEPTNHDIRHSSGQEPSRKSFSFLERLLIQHHRLGSTHDSPPTDASIWLVLSNTQHQQRQQHQKQPSYRGHFQTLQLNTGQSHVIQSVRDLANFRGVVSHVEQTNRQPRDRGSVGGFHSGQTVDVGNSVFPVPYHLHRNYTMETNSIGLNIMEQNIPVVGEIDRLGSNLLLTDFTGPEFGQSGAPTPGITGANNSTNGDRGLASGQNLESTTPSTHSPVTTQGAKLSDTNPLENPIEQVHSEPWGSQIQQIAPLMEPSSGQASGNYGPCSPCIAR